MAGCGHIRKHRGKIYCGLWRTRVAQHNCIGLSNNFYPAKYNTPSWHVVTTFVSYKSGRIEITCTIFNKKLLHNVFYLLIIVPLYFGLRYWPSSRSSLDFRRLQLMRQILSQNFLHTVWRISSTRRNISEVPKDGQ